MLKATVPNLKNKSSKVETLKAAIDYIKAMRSLLGMEDIQDSGRMGEEMDFRDDDGELIPFFPTHFKPNKLPSVSFWQSNNRNDP